MELQTIFKIVNTENETDLIIELQPLIILIAEFREEVESTKQQFLTTLKILHDTAKKY